MTDAPLLHLVACVKVKRPVPAAARDLYCSDWFVKARRYVEQRTDHWYILSAKYGLVGPGDVIAPYDLTLNKMPVSERREWAARVLQQLQGVHYPIDAPVVVLAGLNYRLPLTPWLGQRGVVPMMGLGFGHQKSFLDRPVQTER
ncbi:hypothetical protein IP70_22165 [alpha proteobacterium AAP38]|nr:hypothetical protein IP70_22165 [alpha proteobacterium AAP38]